MYIWCGGKKKELWPIHASKKKNQKITVKKATLIMLIKDIEPHTFQLQVHSCNAKLI